MEEEPNRSELKSILLEMIPDCKDIDMVVVQFVYYAGLFSSLQKIRPCQQKIKEDCKKLANIFSKTDELLSLLDSIESTHLLMAIEEGLQGYEHILNEKELAKESAAGNAALCKIFQDSLHKVPGGAEVQDYIFNLLEQAKIKASSSFSPLDVVFKEIFEESPLAQDFSRKVLHESRPDHPRLTTFSNQLHGFINALESTDKLFGMILDGEGFKEGDARGNATNYDNFAFLNNIGKLFKENTGRYPGFTETKKIVTALGIRSFISDGPIQEWTKSR
jgi:hypothetical protein